MNQKMFIILLNLGALVFMTAFSWWLTGHDKTVSGESKRGHHLTRALRVIGVAFLFSLMLFSGALGAGAGPVLMIAPIGMALILRSSLSELFTHGFLGFIDPTLHDRSEFDPKKGQRYLDAISHLIHTGKREEAIKLCEELKESGEVPLATLEHTLEFLGVSQGLGRAVNPLTEAARLRANGNFVAAENLLKSLLIKNPADDAAALMLMRVYALDMKQSEQACKVLQALEKQPHVSIAHLEFARRSLVEWSLPLTATSAPEPVTSTEPKSVDELLAEGSLGSAVELLESELRAQPGNFKVQLKLAEVYAVHCKNLVKAEKIIRQLEQSSKLDPQLAAMARAKLGEWHTAVESPTARLEIVRPAN